VTFFSLCLLAVHHTKLTTAFLAFCFRLFLISRYLSLVHNNIQKSNRIVYMRNGQES